MGRTPFYLLIVVYDPIKPQPALSGNGDLVGFPRKRPYTIIINKKEGKEPEKEKMKKVKNRG